jgi:hypothetical protein
VIFPCFAYQHAAHHLATLSEKCAQPSGVDLFADFMAHLHDEKLNPRAD